MEWFGLGLIRMVMVALVAETGAVEEPPEPERPQPAAGVTAPASVPSEPGETAVTPPLQPENPAADVKAGEPAATSSPAPTSEPAGPPPAGIAPALGQAAAKAPVPEKTKGPDEDSMRLDEISVTATREERPTLDVPQAIAVIGKERLDSSAVFNVKDAMAGTPGVLIDTKNGGYDARLIIRGAGLRANYGIREVMFLRDGVPLTDPDSLTRLDWVDTQDIQRIEISKGPGNLYSPGSAGGAVQIFSRSVFDPAPDGGSLSRGSFERWNLHLRTSARTDRLAMALSATVRSDENGWRHWNRFDSKQVSLKQGFVLSDTGTLESEIAYTEANIQLPGSMNAELFQDFKDTGRQTGASEPWKHSGRYSRILFANAKLEQTFGNTVLRPRVYYNRWTHRHPVTGVINVTQDGTNVLGTDLEAQNRHERGLLKGTFVAGITFKAQWNNDVRKYQYRDVQMANNRIVATLSDARGELMQQGSHQNILGGVFLQESWQPTRWLILDIGGRLDRTRFILKDDELTAYSYATGSYGPGVGQERVWRSMWLPAPKAGLTFKLNDKLSVYGSAAQAYQVPTESELTYNQELDAARSTSYEIGVKTRSRYLTADLCGYLTRVKNEIVSFRQNGVTVYENAGATNKKGLEAAATLRFPLGAELGFAYSYNDFRYDKFIEQVGQAPADRSGNRLPYAPKHQGSVFALWRHPWGLQLRIQSDSWGSYFLDNANSEKYGGYAWLTGISAKWVRGEHTVGFEAQNVFDQRYAMEVTKDTSGKVLYSAGMPRTLLATYQFRRGP